MKDHVLHIGEKQILGELKELQEIAYNQPKYFEIFKIVSSKMGSVKLGKNRIIELKDYWDIRDLFERGRTKVFLKNKYHLGINNINQILSKKEILFNK